jgi:hypothetical protein
MSRSLLALALLAAVATPALSGCGSSQKTTVEAKSTTAGKELQDLEDARSKGLITESEYKKQRERILKGK